MRSETDEEIRHDLFPVSIWRHFPLYGYFIKEKKVLSVCVLCRKHLIQVQGSVRKWFVRWKNGEILYDWFCSKEDPEMLTMPKVLVESWEIWIYSWNENICPLDTALQNTDLNVWSACRVCFTGWMIFAVESASFDSAAVWWQQLQHISCSGKEK